MSFTIEQLDAAIENEENEWEGSWHEFEYASERFNPETKKYEYGPVDLPGIGSAEIVESKGGGEGDGEERWIVFSVKAEGEDTRYFKRNGYYASHYGSDFDGPTVEVEPAEKLITVWKAIA